MYALDTPHWMYFKLCLHWTCHTGCTSSYACIRHATLDVLQAMSALDMPQWMYFKLWMHWTCHIGCTTSYVCAGHATRYVYIGCTRHVCTGCTALDMPQDVCALDVLQAMSAIDTLHGMYYTIHTHWRCSNCIQFLFTVNLLVYGADTKKKSIHMCTEYAQSVSHSHYYILTVFIFFSWLTFW